MHTVVIGGGYAGLRAAQLLAGRGLPVTLVEPRAEHVLRTRLVAAAAGRIDLNDVSVPYSRLLPTGVHHLKASALRVDPHSGEVETDQQTLRGDRLVLAMGSEARMPTPGAARYGLPLYSLEDLQQLLAHWARLEEGLRREECEPELLRWVIVGGGLVGVELAAELVHLSRRWRRRYGALAEAIQVHLIQRSERLLPDWPTETSEWVLRWLRRHRVIVQLSTQVRRMRPDLVVLDGPEGSEELPTRTLLWAGGIQPVGLEEEPSGLRDARRFLRVDRYCRLVEHPHTYAAGDTIEPFDFANQQPLPPCGQLAVRAGEVIATNIAAEVQGGPLVPFEPQLDRIALSLGAFDGVALVDGQQLYGTAGWTVYQAADLLYYNSILNPLLGQLGPELYQRTSRLFQ
jgi:NADH dehydrogenase